MNENRRKILQMLAAGQVTADEADRLIAALENDPPRLEDPDARPKARPKYLRVVVEAAEDRHGHGPHKVNIRVPMQLLRAGVKLASFIPSQARDHVNDALRKEGVPFDIGQIKPENIEELIDHLDEVTVDVDHKNHKATVMLFCE